MNTEESMMEITDETTVHTVLEVLSTSAEQMPNNCSVSDDHDPQKWHAQAILMGFISSLGLVFNGIVILIIVGLKDYKKTSHWYVLNLAVADAVFLLMLPFNLIESLLGKWPFGYALCVMYNTSFYVNYYAGIFFLTVMSFDRYVAIVHPVSTMWRKFRSNQGCWITTISVWILAVVVALPILVETEILDCRCSIDFRPRDEKLTSCIASGVPLEECEEYHKSFEEYSNSLEELDYTSGMNEMTDYEMILFLQENVYKKNEDHLGEETILLDENLPSSSDYIPFQNLFEQDENLSRSNDSVPLQTLFEQDETLSRPNDSIPVQTLFEQNTIASCYHHKFPFFFNWVTCNFVLTFILPVVIMLICYGFILWRVLHPRIPSSRSSSFRSGNGTYKRRTSSTSSSASHRNNQRITLIVVSLVIVFVMCWLPFHAMNLLKLKGMHLTAEECHSLHVVVLLMAFSNSLLNPVFYTFLGANFHRRLKNVWNRIKTRNTATREMIASFRNAKHNGRGRKPGSLIRKSTKASESSDGHSASANVQLQRLSPAYPADQYTNSTITCKTMLSDERPSMVVK